MFPNAPIDLYLTMILVGIIAAMVLFRVLTTKVGLTVGVFNFSLIVAVVAIVVGFLSATLFQTFYDYIATGIWEWGGMTFYGGLIGAIVVYLLVYFVVGHFIFKDKVHIREFYLMLCCIVPAIVLAHAFGRIGCLFDGCCHGAETESWLGISMYISKGGKMQWVKVMPIQLFESIFLFVLAGALVFLLLKKRCMYTPSIYAVGYGIWRFFIEYLRDDNRGSTGIDWLTPSQLTAIIFVVVGVALGFLYKYVLKRFFTATIKEKSDDSPLPENESTDS